MTEYDEILVYSIVWILLFMATLLVTFRRRTTVGLTAAFLMIFSVNHWLASALYVVPWQTLYPPSMVAAGLRQSVLGMAAFTFGALVLTPIAARKLQQVTAPVSLDQIQRDLPGRVKHYMLVGLIFYFIAPLLYQSPKLSNSFSILNVPLPVLSKFIMLAAYLFIYMKVRTGSRHAWASVILIAALFPLTGVIYTGFASFGSVMSIVLIVCYLSYSKIDIKKAAFLVLAGYIGLSSFVVYFSNRSDIRASVWGDTSLSSRLEVLSNTVNQFELFSLDNPRHLRAVDARLNRNYFVGAAIRSLDSGSVDYLRGETFLDIFIAPIPRMLWPEKPYISGGSELFSQFTGIKIYGSTTAGVGLLLEGYINFGSAGVVGLFALYAVLLGLFDAQCRRNLDTGNYDSLAIWFLAGFGLVSADETLASTVGAVVTALVVLKAWNFVLGTRKSGNQRVQMAPMMPDESLESARPAAWNQAPLVRPELHNRPGWVPRGR